MWSIQTLLLEHTVGLLNLGFFFKPQSPAIEDLCHSVFDFLWSPGSKVLHRKIDPGHINIPSGNVTSTFCDLPLAYQTNRIKALQVVKCYYFIISQAKWKSTETVDYNITSHVMHMCTITAFWLKSS